jgi:hypothetical protein
MGNWLVAVVDSGLDPQSGVASLDARRLADD